ncbi:aminotransferase class I/II-fold pyridoxal phosphate-dependent enzyme [Schleiferiaceae bacterium]|nr:aminotransferase class I/II-fold pyridoxal phosphate-dependent enzyme [Schleiferiaceae bacterium]
MEKIWLSSPHMGGTEQDYVNSAFEANWIAPLGPNVNGFESDIQSFTGAEHAAALSSGTGAIHIALDILGVGKGDYVFVQSFTFCASVNPIEYLGATPVFIDSEKDSWNMCPEALEEALQHFDEAGKIDKVKAILPVHLYGVPARMDVIIKLAEKYGIPIVEDAAESLGATVNGKHTGTFGEFGVYSFNGNKIITTSGGGALVSASSEKIQLARKLATQARDDAPHYQHSMIGYNYRMSNICAGIGRGQMEVLDERIKQRRANFERYLKIFEKLGWNAEYQNEPEGVYANRWLSAFYFEPKVFGLHFREELRLFLESLNIESRPLWKPMHLQPVYKDCQYFGKWHNAEKVFDFGLCLPSGSNLTKDEWERIESAIIEFSKR